jgi:hypothetical protein
MAQTLATIRNWTQYLVGDPQHSTYDLSMYQDAINFAVKEYANKTGATYAESDPIVPDASGFVAIPDDYLRVTRVSFNVGGTTLTELVESSVSFESMKSNVWKSLMQDTAGFPPKRWVLWSGSKIKLIPIPNPVYTAVVGYVQKPVDLTLDTDTVDARIPDPHNEFLKYAAASWLLSLDGDGQSLQLAEAFMQKFNQLIGYADPVLLAKVQQTRTQAEREM